MMKILCIGGTKFVGRKFVEDALSNGHEVYILQRGKTNLNLFPKVTKYFGDRISISKILPPDEYYDMVVDFCGYHPSIVKESCQFLKDKTNLYVFISTCSVYADFSVVGLNEKSQTSKLDIIPSVDSPMTNENYGPLKALCESVVRETFESSRSLILRPCIIVGPYDDSNRFDKLIKFIMQSELRVPNDPNAFIQFVDVRAISEFILKSQTNGIIGTFNLIGPQLKTGLLSFIEQAKSILNPNLKITLSDDDKIEFPMYICNPNFKGFFQFDGSKAYENGFPNIAIEDTVLATASYLKSK